MFLFRPTIRNIISLPKSNFIRCISTASEIAKSPCIQTGMLNATLGFVPRYGWSMTSLIHGAHQLGYPSVAHGIFPSGEIGLIDAYLKKTRADYIQLVEEKIAKQKLEGLTVNEKMRMLIWLRLNINKPFIKKWPEALSILAHPSNIDISLKHLSDIADDICFYAGDRSPDMNWYIKRASVAAIYSSSELYMTQDISPNFIETEKFLQRRICDTKIVESATSQIGNMLCFGTKSLMSVLTNRGGKF